ncbi:GSCOCG00007382001-RA-CDS [Cotesia congregata]|nr:GSCOCG00007382001-RA-CDS [Cotesia congregata]
MIKHIFKNFLYKASGEPIVKIEKNDSEDSGIDDPINIPDDNNSQKINDSSNNQLNVGDVIELISEDEDDSLKIVEIQDDETPDVTSSVRQLSNLESHDSKSQNNTILFNNEKTLMEDHPSLIEGIINSNKSNESQSLVQQNSVDSASADNPQDMCEKYEADCQKKITNSSNILPSLIIRNQKTDCSNEDETNKSLMLVENNKPSIIQHQVSNTTVTTTQKNQFYIINNPYIKPIQSEFSESTNKCSQSKDILKRVTPKKKNLPKIVIENVNSNSQNIPPKLLLYNPHNRISIPINGIVSSTPVAREKKSEGASLKNNNNNVLESDKRNNTSFTRESVSKKMNKNIDDKVTESPTIVQVESSKEISHAANVTNTPTSDKTATLNTTVNSSPKEGTTTIGSTSSNLSQTTVTEPGNSRSTQTISFNKKNNTSSISAPTPNFQKTIPVPEKSNTILMSSIGVQTDPEQNSVAKNLKRKATDDNAQDATASCSHNQGAPPAKKQKIQSSEEVSDVIIHLDGKSANRIEISNELLENGQERQIVSQFFEKISSVVIVQPPSITQSIVKIINKSLRSTNQNSAANNETLRTVGDNNISNNNETSLNKDSRQENSENQEAASSNEPVNSNEKPTNNDSNINERSMNENLNNNQTLNKSIVNEKLNDKSHLAKENSNNTNLNANIKIQRNEPVASTSTAPVETQTVNQNFKSENNFGSSFSPSGFVQYGTRLLNKTDKICFTGEMDEKRQIAIEKLGGQITNDPTDATVLVADKFRRTFKFICAICRSIPIVSTQWINESITKNNFVNPYKYILKDEEAEKNYGFNLEESLMKAKKKQLFRDYTVLITNGVNRPSVNELRTIVKFAGGRPLVRAPKYWGPKSMIISCDDDAPKVRKILEKKPQEILCPVVSADFILSSLLKQDLEINTNNLKVEKK